MLKRISKMYFVVVCPCGKPIGYIWRRYILAKLLTFTKYTDEVYTLMASIESAFKDSFD